MRPVCLILTLLSGFWVFTQEELYLKEIDGYSILGRDDAIAFSDNKYIYTGTGNHGGFAESNRFYRFSYAFGSLEEVNSFPGTPRQYASAIAVDRYGYIFGGISPSGVPLNDVWQYDMELDQWNQLNNFPFNARWAATVFKVDDRIFFGTGRDTVTSFNDFWEYIPSTDQWFEIESFPSEPIHETVSFTVYQKGYVGLGRYDNGELSDAFFMYDPVKGVWTPIADYPAGPRYYATATSHYSWGFVVGGQNESGEILGDVWKYDPLTDLWNSPEGIDIDPTRGMTSTNRNGQTAYFLFGLTTDFERSSKIWSLQNKHPATPSEEPFVSVFYQMEEQYLAFQYVIPGKKIRIFDLSGRMVDSFVPHQSSGVYDCKHLSTGMYVVRQKTFSYQWIKN